MNNKDVKPKHIIQWINEKESGNPFNYDRCKNDTQEGLYKLYKFYDVEIESIEDVTSYLIEELELKGNAHASSFYRAFIAIQNDDIINLRLTRHFSTEKATSDAINRNGASAIEYHLVIEKVQMPDYDKSLWRDCVINGTMIVVHDIPLTDFLDYGKKSYIIDELIRLLTLGKPGLNENNIKDMKQNKIRLTESQLRNMIAEAIKEIGDTPAGEWMLGRLAGRQRNRAKGEQRDGKVKSTSVDARDYARNLGLEDDVNYTDSSDYNDIDNDSPFMAGHNLENTDWYDRGWGSHSANCDYSNMIDGYAKAMGRIINQQRNKKTIKESQLRNMIAESVKSVLNEIGDTNRGQYMLGRVARRALDGGRFDTLHAAKDRKNPNDTEAFYSGYDDEKQTDSYKKHRIKFNYDTYKTRDMDNIGRKFIDFIEHYQGGVLMQTIIDYESGNQTGTPSSPLSELIPMFEEEVLGYECSNDVRKAIESAYNQWWFYAESELMPEEEY